MHVAPTAIIRRWQPSVWRSRGEAGQRTASRLGFEVSADTLLRRARSVPDPDNVTVRVLGVDDFAFRRGSRYGTILIDQEKREPIDLLPDREAKTLRQWLAAHPEVEVITRDRSPSYAEGARQGAPQATQVADRFHLIKNLREAVERVLAPRHAALREAAREISPRYQTEQMLRAEGLIEALPARPAGNKPRTQQLGEQRREQRMARYQEVKNLKQQGLPIRQIARRLGLHRETVRNFLRAETFPERATSIPRPTMVEKFADYLKKRWQEGCENGKRLYEEISARGFTGSPATLRRHLRDWRRQLPEVFQKMKQLPDFPPPSPRQASWWLLKQTDELEQQEREYVQELTRLNPEIKTAEVLAKGFQELARQRREQSFDQWREEVNQSGLAELKSFADSLMTDEAAVREALRSEWSNGQTEGQINRLKMIKRTMFGRAKLDLLRARVLHAP